MTFSETHAAIGIGIALGGCLITLIATTFKLGRAAGRIEVALKSLSKLEERTEAVLVHERRISALEDSVAGLGKTVLELATGTSEMRGRLASQSGEE